MFVNIIEFCPCKGKSRENRSIRPQSKMLASRGRDPFDVKWYDTTMMRSCFLYSVKAPLKQNNKALRETREIY